MELSKHAEVTTNYAFAGNIAGAIEACTQDNKEIRGPKGGAGIAIISDLQIGLRVRLFNRSSHGLDCHLCDQNRKQSFLLYWTATGRSIVSGDVTSLKLESCSRTQSRTRSPI